MSYVVHLWEAAAPANLHEADRLHVRLAGTAAAANPKFAQLAQALMGRFPAEVGGRGSAAAEWVESPPDGQTESRVYSLGLYEEGTTQLLPVLVEVATALGLTVYDDQAGRVYLPGGWALDSTGRRPLQAEPAVTFPTVAQARTVFKREVLPKLATHGFKLARHNLGLDFVRQRPSGEQKLTVALRNLFDQAMEVKPFTMVYLALPPGIEQTVGTGRGLVPLFSRQCKPLQAFLSDSAPLDARYPEFLAASETQLQALARAYLVHVQETWLPLLDAIAAPPGLVQCDRESAPHEVDFGSSYGTLGMAHWVGAPDFEAIVENHAARMAATNLRGLVPVLRSMAEKLKGRPDLFGIYPRMDPS